MVEFEKASLDDLYKEIVTKNQGNYKTQPKEIQDEIVRLFRIIFAEKADMVVSTTELRKWLLDYGMELVFDSLVDIHDLEPQKKNVRYLGAILEDKWKQAKPRTMTWQMPIKRFEELEAEIAKSYGEPASDECVIKNDPKNMELNFKAREQICRLCGYPIRINNVTKICARCQRRGNKVVSNFATLKTKRITMTRRKAFAAFDNGKTPDDFRRIKGITRKVMKNYYLQWLARHGESN